MKNHLQTPIQPVGASDSVIKGKTVPWLRRWKLHYALLCLFSFLSLMGCSDITVHYYDAVEHPLDANNVIRISTYAAGFPNKTKSVPFVYEAIETPKNVYLQVFVRAAGQKGGPNPNVDTIVIHSVSYNFPGQPPKQLTSGFHDYLWMQGDSRYGDPRYKQTSSQPIPFGVGWHFIVKIDMTLNGKHHLIEKKMKAATRTSRKPLIMKAFQ
jgi:hypothetical protein